jgi:chemotaxis protein histidine kinase CheA
MASTRAGEVEFAPPPGGGYVDLFSDIGSGSEQLPDKPDDPFLAAARASLPDTYGSGTPGAPDPFVALREDLSAPRASREAPPRLHPPVPKVPVIPKPRPQKSTVPIALIGGGVAVLVGILAFVILSAGKKERTAPERAAAAEPAPIPPPPLAPPAQEAPQTAPPPAEPAPQAAQAQRRESDEERRARAERLRREREDAQARANEARAERDARDRAARVARDRDRADREARAREEREARAAREREARDARDREARAARDAREREKAEREALAREERQRVAAATAAEEAEGGLTQAQIEGVLRSTKTAFDGCIQAARGTDVKLDGRRVMLRLNIQTSGTVTYPTLDDVTLNGTELGSCLKSAARLMVFPKFKGDTMHVEVPLVMR